jgi:hypothetical protein
MQTDHTTKLAQLYGCIIAETLEELANRALLHFSDDHWRFGDDNNGTRRRLDGKKWKMKTGEQIKAFSDTEGAEWHRLIGLDDVVRNDRPYALLTIEGSKDALAAAEFARRIDALPETGIMCALGSGYRPIPSELHKLAGRWVGVIGDNGETGIETAQLVSFALNTAGVDHVVWDWSKVSTNASDFFEFWADCILKEVKSFKNPFVKLLNGTVFSPAPPSYNSTIQPFNPSTTETSEGETGLIGVTIEKFIAPYVLREEGTTRRQSFGLARAIKSTNTNITMNELTMIYDDWFEKSRAFLPKDADRDAYFEAFMRQLTRVRFTASALNAAMERARKTKLFVPALDGNAELTKLAALCRELQREAGNRPFICPVNIAQRFLNLKWPSGANWLLHQLECNGVIECVERGVPNKPGQKGKSTFWRYKLLLD